jgi:hypothetical protein
MEWAKHIAEQVIFIATGTMEELNINEQAEVIVAMESETAVIEKVEKSEKVEKGKKKTHHDTK